MDLVQALSVSSLFGDAHLRRQGPCRMILRFSARKLTSGQLPSGSARLPPRVAGRLRRTRRSVPYETQSRSRAQRRAALPVPTQCVGTAASAADAPCVGALRRCRRTVRRLGAPGGTSVRRLHRIMCLPQPSPRLRIYMRVDQFPFSRRKKFQAWTWLGKGSAVPTQLRRVHGGEIN